MCKAAEKYGVEQGVIRWIRAMLGSLKIVTAQISCRLRVSVNQGCLQDGVLSPVQWSLVVDGLPAQLNREGLYTQDKADDLALLTTGKFPITLLELMEKALNIGQSWCKAKELHVNPDKMKLVLFTKKKSGWVLRTCSTK
jgi:hypothetical protein